GVGPLADALGDRRCPTGGRAGERRDRDKPHGLQRTDERRQADEGAAGGDAPGKGDDRAGSAQERGNGGRGCGGGGERPPAPVAEDSGEPARVADREQSLEELLRGVDDDETGPREQPQRGEG